MKTEPCNRTDCKYFLKNAPKTTERCGYFMAMLELRMGTCLRGCPVNDACTKYELNEKSEIEKKKPKRPFTARISIPEFNTAEALKMYKNDATDEDIASTLHVSKHEITKWRISCKLPGVTKQHTANTKIIKSKPKSEKPKPKIDVKKHICDRKQNSRISATNMFKREKIKQLHSEGKNDREISVIIGMSIANVQRSRKRMGLSAIPQYYECDWNRVRKLYYLGMTDREIGEAVGRATSSIQHWRNSLKLRSNPSPYNKRVKNIY